MTVTLFAAILYLALTDFSRYRTDIEIAITEATGREFRIAGDFTPKAFPLSLVAEGISLANADWGSDAPFLSIGHVSAKIDIGSLFSGPTRVKEFRLHDVSMLLQKNAAGEDNWSMGTDQAHSTPQPDYAGVGDGVPLIVEFAELRNIEVIYRVAGAEDRVMTLASLDVLTNDDGYIEATGAGQVVDSNLSVNGSIGPVDHFDSGADVEFDFESYLGVISISASGNTGQPQTLAGARLDAVITSDDIGAVLTLLDIPIDLSGPLRIESKLSSQDQRPVFDVDASVGDIEAHSSFVFSDEQIDFEASVTPLSRIGDIAKVAGLPDAPLTARGGIEVRPDSIELHDVFLAIQSVQVEIDGSVGRSPGAPNTIVAAFSSDNLQEIYADLPAIALTSTVTARIAPQQVELTSFEVKFADSDFSGTLDLGLGDPVSVTGNLHSDLLDLSPFAGEPQETTDAATATEPSSEKDEAQAAPTDFVFSEDPLPFDFLNAGTVDVQLVIDEFRQGPLRLDDLEATLRLLDGTLNLESGFAVTDGGNATAAIALASTESNAELDIKFDLSDLRLSLSENNERSVAEIPLIGLQAEIRSSGTSLREIAASANGKVLFTQGEGKIDNSAMSFFSADIVAQLFGALNPFAKDEPFSIWECTVFGLDIVDGVAEILPMLAQSDKLTIVATGDIDLNNEELHVSFNTKPRRGVGISADMFVTPFIRLGGSLAAPRMALDKKGVIVSGGAAVLTGGISFFVQGAADRASGATDRCAAALAIANGQDVEPESCLRPIPPEPVTDTG